EQLSEKLKGLSLTEIQAELTKLENKLADKKAARAKWQQGLDKLQQQVSVARDKLAQAEKFAAAGEKEFHNTLKASTEAKAMSDKLKEQAEEKKSALELAVTSLEIPLENLEDTGEKLKTGDAKTASYQKELAVREKEQSSARASLEQTETELRQVELELSRLEAEQLGLKEQTDTKSTQLQAITGGKPTAILKEETQQKLEDLLRESTESGDNYETCRASRENVRQSMAQASREQELTDRNLLKAREKLIKVLAEHQFTTSGEANAALCSAEERGAMLEEVKAFREAEKLLEHKLKLLAASLQGRSLTLEEWENWEHRQLEAETVYQAAVREAGGADIQLKAIDSKNLRWNKLERQRLDLRRLKDQLETLQRLFRGNSFVEFLSEEQITNVARVASERLKQMTRHRYALEVDSDGGFVMRDDANGGVRRPVSTLSGGETFMTSLALALALSAQIQLKGEFPLEFFFLDEGFGTLDPELLDKVMSTLEELPADRMTIGVISHVPEMRMRMARKLVVDPAQPGIQGTRVQFETS
ncbi:MAG TPA: SbcC/MukB-like Walker B domain-containing protein, partial [Bacillota bacterium]|nr:SbcC/MukB-like Walker B domain-containing protein [Bacillota bacterium]